MKYWKFLGVGGVSDETLEWKFTGGGGAKQKNLCGGGGGYGYFLELHIQAKLVEREIHEKGQQTNKFHDLQELCRPVNPQQF